MGADPGRPYKQKIDLSWGEQFGIFPKALREITRKDILLVLDSGEFETEPNTNIPGTLVKPAAERQIKISGQTG